MSINGITGLSDPNPVQPTRPRGRQEFVERTEARDAVEISPDAQAAAEAARYNRESRAAEVRQAQVEAAKQRIQEGSYRMYDVVEQVASRIAGLI